MSASPECGREPEILGAILEGRWPDSSDAELRVHAARCESCADLVEVGVALSHDRNAARREPNVPAPGILWRRMQIRARREAERSYRRAMVAVQAGMVAGAVITVSAVVRSVSMPGLPWLRSLRDAIDLASIGALAMHWSLPIALALMAWLALAPAAAWFALSDD